MGLSNDLLYQFAKITSNKTAAKKETIVYGTVKNGGTSVSIDGSDRLTPIVTAMSVKDGDRVMVTIKDHTAIVTSNISSPAARIATVNEIDGRLSVFIDDLEATNIKVQTLVADNATITGTLNVATANIDKLVAKNAEIEGSLTAQNGEIENLKSKKIDAETVVSTYATIGSLEAANADIRNLTAEFGEFNKATIDRLEAHDADINTLKANNADIEDLTATVGKIDTLMFGSASGNILQTDFANAVVAQLGDAQIKSAMIESVSAAKITAGDIITNNVQVKSEDGSLLISDETIQISDDNRVRVQIGKDASDDYSINIWDAEGNLMFSEGGITDSAIKSAIIRDDMVAENANISGSKLDIDSLFTEMNKDGTQTLKSTKVYLDEEKQTLDVSFKTLSGEVSSQGTALSVIQGQITSKIWEQDINAATRELNTKYSTLEQTVEGLTVEVGDSAKTATNFLKYDGVSGSLIVGDLTGDAVGRNVLIDTDSIDIRNGNTVLASFGEKTINLGIAAENSTIKLCGGNGIITLNEYGTGEEYLEVRSVNDLRLSADNDIWLYAVEEPDKTYDSAFFHMGYTLDATTSKPLYPNASINTLSGTTLSDRLRGHFEISPYGASLTCDNGSINLIADTAEQYTYADINLTARSGRLLVNSENVTIDQSSTKLPSTLTIGSRQYGVNKVLWSGLFYMMNTQTAPLTEAISAQPHGVVLVFNGWDPSSKVETNPTICFFIPKHVCQYGYGFSVSMSSEFFMGIKELYIYDSRIVGYSKNSLTVTHDSGITFTNTRFILRYVIGV